MPSLKTVSARKSVGPSLIGYFHGQFRGNHGLVYDLSGALRPLVDRAVLEFVQRHVSEPDDFTLTGEVVCRLNPELTRNVVRVNSTAIDRTVHSNAFARTLLLRG
jgi:CRISPR/Cas system-associated endonuclease Cas1